MKMSDLPSFRQPRKLFQQKGPKSLSDEELIALIIGSGTKKKNALQIAHTLVKKYPLQTLPSISYSQLKATGIGEIKAQKISATVELADRIHNIQKKIAILSAEDIWRQLAETRGKKKEYFIIYYLDVRNTVIAKETISIGTLNASLVHPREVFEPAIRYLSAQIILTHNHPSDYAEPSEEDILLTKRLQAAGNIIGIHVIDHIIVTEHTYYSFLEHHIL